MRCKPVPKKLLEETKRLIRLKMFLDECGLKKYRFTTKELRKILRVL